MLEFFFVGRTGTCPEGLEEFDLFLFHVFCESVCEFCISHFDDIVRENMIKIKGQKLSLNHSIFYWKTRVWAKGRTLFKVQSIGTKNLSKIFTNCARVSSIKNSVYEKNVSNLTQITKKLDS